MKKAILPIMITLILLSMVKCTHSLYSGFKNFPEYASSEVLSNKYQELISDIDEQIANGNTVLSMGANLETIRYPAGTVYVAMVKEGEGDDIIVKGEIINGSRSSFIKNGFGYGKLAEQDIVIITRPIDRFGLEDVVVYLTYDFN